jgi:hypothetical protein
MIMKATLEKILTSYHKEGMIARMRANPKLFDEAVKMALADTPIYSWRAAWLLWSVMEKNDPRIQKHIKDFISILKTAGDSRQREILHILMNMEISPKFQGLLFDACITLWEDISKQPSVRVTAFRIILRIVIQHPELVNEVDYLLQNHFLETLSPGAKHSVNKMIKTLPGRAKE